MNKVSILLVVVFAFSTLHAAAYKGQREFVRNCVECHDTGQAFVAEKRMRYWDKVTKRKGKELAEIHLKSKKAKKSWKYFKARRYEKMSRHLSDFLQEYAKDSGNVPACN